VKTEVMVLSSAKDLKVFSAPLLSNCVSGQRSFSKHGLSGCAKRYRGKWSRD
jgi:hypothetical protein